MPDMGAVKKRTGKQPYAGHVALIRGYLKGLSIQERKRCAKMCGVSLYTLYDMMREKPRNIRQISPSVVQGLHKHSKGVINKVQIREDLYGADDEN